MGQEEMEKQEEMEMLKMIYAERRKGYNMTRITPSAELSAIIAQEEIETQEDTKEDEDEEEEEEGAEKMQNKEVEKQIEMEQQEEMEKQEEMEMLKMIYAERRKG